MKNKFVQMPNTSAGLLDKREILMAVGLFYPAEQATTTSLARNSWKHYKADEFWNDALLFFDERDPAAILNYMSSKASDQFQKENE